ncbi:hypothetical protein QWY28_11800 [Nocardioides sp. SOB77]|uniref:Uncharacterized protein n=1 Tax=Nocardioides oceani TaxID=3058369 RepID=A0ABT8FG26_9ACTN|nr:hypothetical protein [Nocardioides oceani]MDN4173633.1 hypothetical protein [Nocardioides oceani]
MGLLGRRRERKLHEAETFRAARKLAAEDVTVLGEELAELHLDTLTTELDDAMRTDYRMALDRYDAAKTALDQATTTEHVDALATHLADARWARARVLARRDGRPLPERREECFFNPQHGPAQFDLDWTPPGGTPRTIAVCATDHQRLTRGEQPATRMVRAGDRYVPWYAADIARSMDSTYAAHVVRGHSYHSQAALLDTYLRSAGNGSGGAAG